MYVVLAWQELPSCGLRNYKSDEKCDERTEGHTDVKSEIVV